MNKAPAAEVSARRHLVGFFRVGAGWKIGRDFHPQITRITTDYFGFVIL
jgi:hypothetical protein